MVILEYKLGHFSDLCCLNTEFKYEIDLFRINAEPFVLYAPNISVGKISDADFCFLAVGMIFAFSFKICI